MPPRAPIASRRRVLLTAIAPVLGGLLGYGRQGGWGWLLLIAIAGGLLLLALLAPARHAPVHRALEGLVQGILRVFSWIVLGLAFTLLIIPGRLLLGRGGKHPLHRPGTKSTGWQNAASPSSPESFQRPF